MAEVGRVCGLGFRTNAPNPKPEGSFGVWFANSKVKVSV